MIDEFFDLMRDRVTFEPFLGTDLYAKRSDGNPILVEHARVVWENVKTTDDAGQDIVAKGKIYLGGVYGITPAHRVTLPDGSQPPIVRVLKYPDEKGGHHEVVLFA